VQHPLLAGSQNAAAFPQESSVERQWLLASKFGTAEAWQSIERYFPKNTYYILHAKEQLALLYLQEGDYDRALALFKQLAQAVQYESIRAFGLAGWGSALCLQGKYRDSAEILQQLWPNRDQLQNRRMQQLLQRAIQKNRSQLGTLPNSDQWDQWLNNLFKEEPEEPENRILYSIAETRKIQHKPLIVKGFCFFLRFAARTRGLPLCRILCHYCAAFCAAFFLALARPIKIGIGHLEVMFIGNHGAIANPSCYHMQRIILGEFRFAGRPEILEKPLPRFLARPENDFLKGGPQVRRPYPMPCNDVLRTCGGIIKDGFKSPVDFRKEGYCPNTADGVVGRLGSTYRQPVAFPIHVAPFQRESL
jgi:hypothetical protein